LLQVSTTVRRAVESDQPWLLTQLKSFSSFYGNKKEFFGDEAHASQVVSALVQGQVVLVAESERGLLGFVAGQVIAHPFNPNLKVLAELFWWVVPEHRKSRAGLMLLNEFTAWGKQNVDVITFCLLPHSDARPKSLLSRGYVAKETTYLLEVN
jgi:hypothetical protein